eukprot:COSAG06_NODE_36009_length_453_cov_0.372881_1_plen_150_part_11
MEVQSSASGSWTRIWGSSLGAGSYSLDGLHIRFERQDVVGVRLGSVPHGNPSFAGWSGAVFHFGRGVGAGSVSVSAANMLALASGESVSVSSEVVSVVAGSSVEVSSGETVRVTGEVVSVESTSAVGARGERVAGGANAIAWTAVGSRVS